jgi:hypothetical protein
MCPKGSFVKSGHERPYFFIRAYMKLYLRVYGKSDDIVNVKNALIKSVFRVKEYTIYSHIITKTLFVDTVRLDQCI